MPLVNRHYVVDDLKDSRRADLWLSLAEEF